MGAGLASKGRCGPSAATLAALVLLVPAPAGAALLGNCAITVLDSGRMVPDPAIGTLDSSRPGGSSARVQVNANSTVCWVLGLLDCYRISALAPASFLAYPAGGDTGATFSTSYRINGGNRMAGAVQTEVLNGQHVVTVDLAATRAPGIFPAGTYQAQVTIRCE